MRSRRTTSAGRSPSRSTSTSARRTAVAAGEVASAPSASAARSRCSVSRRSGLRLEQHGRAQRPRRAEERRERRAQLLRAERLVLEERQLPPVERLGEMGVGVGEPEPDEKLCGERPAKLVEPGRLARAAAWPRSAARAGCRTGRPSRVSKRTGPAASGAAVASRIADTASAISAGASGTSSPGPSAARSSITQ